MAATTAPLEDRIDRLSTVSLKRVIEPDRDVPGYVGAGAVLPAELLSVAGLGLDLTPEQEATLSREEVAAIVDAGIRFEAVLLAGFGLQIAGTERLTDPRVVYALHELGEETRHSRLFIRLLDQLQPTAKNPFDQGLPDRLMKFVVPRLLRKQALFVVLVLTGEEIPDLLQKLASEHPDTDPFVREVNRYHRQEEARHLAYARMVLPERWRAAGRGERFVIRWLAPGLIRMLFDTMVHPGVYAAAGLDPWKTWKAVRANPQRVALRQQALRPLLDALVDAGALRRSRIPRPWRELCGVAGETAP